MKWLFLCVSLLFAACESGGGVGAACKTDKNCASGLGCANEPFPDGYCTQDCSASECGDGQVCTFVAGQSFCLKPCESTVDCRDGYQCHNGVCTLRCDVENNCGTGMQCVDGECKPFDGDPLGAACTDDMTCASRVCLNGACVGGCDKDAACADGETCALNPIPATGAAASYRLACVPRRGAGANAAACESDAECDRGSCQLGVCVEICTTTPDCHGEGLACADMTAWAPATDATLPFKGCLPGSGIISMAAPTGVVPIPSTAKSFAIYTRLTPFDLTNYVGVVSLADPTGKTVYTAPQTREDFFAADLRYLADTAASTMLVPNSPRVTVMPGLYLFSVQSLRPATIDTRVFIKLGDAATGKATLNFYLTDLSQSCEPMNVNTAPGILGSEINLIKQIFASAGVTIDQVTFKSTNANNAPAVDMNDDRTDVAEILQQATANQGTTPGFDVVIVRRITDPQGNPSGVLGIAGAIPSSPVLGTPHSGAIVSIGTFCNNVFGETTAHELGHTLGLFHNVEQTKETDPIPDTGTDSQNLMYWLENGGRKITPQQAAVIRSDMKVRP